MENLIKISEKELKNNKISGNYLYKDDNYYYFANNFNHIIFREANEKDATVIQNLIDFEKYVEDFCYICNKIENRPNIIFSDYYKRNLLQILNEEQRNYKIIDNEEFKDKSMDNVVNFFEKETFITNINKIDRFLKDFIEKRQNTSKNVVIFIYQPERTRILEKLDFSEILPQCIEKNVTIIFNILDKEKFLEVYGEEKYNSIIKNSVEFICKNQDVIDIKSGENSLIFDNLQKNQEITPKNQSKTVNNSKILEKPSFSYYLQMKKENNKNFDFNLNPSKMLTLFRAKRVIKNMPESLKEWYSTYDGGMINGAEIFGTTYKNGVTSLKKANSQTFIKKFGLPDGFYYIARYKNEYFIGLNNNWENISKYNSARDFNIVHLQSEKGEKSIDFDFYEVLDYIEGEQDDD